MVAAGAGVAADGTGQVMLDQGDVLQVFTWRPDNADPNQPIPSDLTGTRVVGDKPIQVIGGSKCTNVPFNIAACDRLEDAMLPLNLASESYLLSAPVEPNTDGAQLARRMIRIVATEDDTSLSYNPNVPNAPTKIDKAGDYIEIDSLNTFVLNASKPVLAAEYMTGVAFGGGGDPSMALSMPTTGFLTEYLVFAPTNFTENWVNVIFDKDTVIELDGGTTIDANGAQQVGVSSWRIARVKLSNAGDGTHSLVVKGDGMGFGLSIYGYAAARSYWYPGGVDLPVE
jgi:hypothetical protein